MTYTGCLLFTIQNSEEIFLTWFQDENESSIWMYKICNCCSQWISSVRCENNNYLLRITAMLATPHNQCENEKKERNTKQNTKNWQRPCKPPSRWPLHTFEHKFFFYFRTRWASNQKHWLASERFVYVTDSIFHVCLI